MFKAFSGVAKLHEKSILYAGNIESGIVADCSSKELLVGSYNLITSANMSSSNQEVNSCQEKDDLFTCVCNSDG